MNLLIRACSLIAALSFAFTANAAWPDRPIKIIVAPAAGSSTDVATRLVAEKVSKLLGQPIVIENRPGAGSVLGTDYGAKQPPDGYTFTMGAVGPLAIAPALNAAPVPYNPETDFVGVSTLVWAPQVLVVRQAMPVTNLREFIEYAKKRPETRPLTFGTQGNGTTFHLVISQMLRQTGMRADHIPYKSGPAAIADLIGGQLDFVSETVPVVLPLLASGQVKALAVAADKRIQTLPNVPTFQEAGVANMNMQGWITMLAPAKTPEPIVQRMSQAVDSVMKMPDVRKRMLELGMTPMDMPREDMLPFLRSEMQKWKEAVRMSGAAQTVR
jgi:tripartite-type tricarboxylate transporter receptor subunit TctC